MLVWSGLLLTFQSVKNKTVGKFHTKNERICIGICGYIR